MLVQHWQGVCTISTILQHTTELPLPCETDCLSLGMRLTRFMPPKIQKEFTVRPYRLTMLIPRFVFGVSYGKNFGQCYA